LFFSLLYGAADDEDAEKAEFLSPKRSTPKKSDGRVATFDDGTTIIADNVYHVNVEEPEMNVGAFISRVPAVEANDKFIDVVDFIITGIEPDDLFNYKLHIVNKGKAVLLTTPKLAHSLLTRGAHHYADSFKDKKKQKPATFRCVKAKKVHDTHTTRIHKSKSYTKTVLYLFPPGMKMTLNDLLTDANKKKNGRVEPTDIDCDFFQTGKDTKTTDKHKTLPSSLCGLPCAVWHIMWRLAIDATSKNLSYLEEASDEEDMELVTGRLNKLQMDFGDAFGKEEEEEDKEMDGDDPAGGGPTPDEHRS
jgi:hypothetical protein